ncbi:MAG: prepilin-type N-terminal cleavage/methylation domain-containing protein [Bryobacteraceae bacterium]|nr:prepilin-type N-terminal cleavage/methylation domain-containing protein [Bryobacteraceae bacterium]
MPTLSVGRANSRGVTLIEMLIVVSIIGLMVGVSFPSVNSGIDTIRLMSASDSVVSFLNAALNRAERRQQVMEVTISQKTNMLALRSIDAGFLRELELPTGVTITRVLPEGPDDADRHIYLYPGGTVPRIGVELTNTRGAKRVVRVDPVSGIPATE